MLLGISLELESKLGIRVWDEESNVRVVLLNRIAWVGLLYCLGRGIRPESDSAKT